MANWVVIRVSPTAPGVTQSTRLSRGWNRIKTQIVPITLKSTCTNAACRATVFVPMEARAASMVVPILAPRIIAAAIG
ncbi:hypothetical protein Holit_02783 [Hollandina sp. SP2]